MAGSMNKVILIGNVGQDPRLITASNGNRLARLSLATSETWRDKQSGERKERTEWHHVVILNENIVAIVEKYVGKGSKLCIEGQLHTREYEKDGQKRFATDVVVKGFSGSLTLLDPPGASRQAAERPQEAAGGETRAKGYVDSLSDEIPF